MLFLSNWPILQIIRCIVNNISIASELELNYFTIYAFVYLIFF